MAADRITGTGLDHGQYGGGTWRDRRSLATSEAKDGLVRLADALDQQIQKMGFRLESARSVSRIEAPMPGLILSVSVSPGDTVKKGDPLLVLEAMKMENNITAEKEGTVSAVHVVKDQKVLEKELMIELD